jgi:hypothetical protein
MLHAHYLPFPSVILDADYNRCNESHLSVTCKPPIYKADTPANIRTMRWLSTGSF